MRSLGLHIEPTLRQINHFWSRVGEPTNTGCMEWIGFLNDAGYGHVTVDKVGIRTHRVAYCLFFGDIPPGMVVMHACDNPSCCNPEHLSLGTTQDNTADCVRKGRKVISHGEKGGASKLKDEDVLRIIEMCKFGANQHSVASAFGVHQSAISRIAHGVRWKRRVGELSRQSQ